MLRVLDCIGAEHDWPLLVVAAVICLLGSIAAISLFHRARALQGRTRMGWLLAAGAAAGCGVWATHFIAMLAYTPGLPVSYAVPLTAISLLVAMMASALGLAWALYGSQRWGAVIGGAIVGLGIVGMHYLGMAALRVPGYFTWSPDLIAASVVFSVLFGAGAIALAARGEALRHLVGGAGLLALAILSLHFTAMGALTITPLAMVNYGPMTLSPVTLAIAVAAVAASLLAMCLIGAFSDRGSKAQIEEQNRRFSDALNNMSQGLCMFDANNRLQVWNQRYLDMYNIPPEVLRVGCTTADIVAARQAVGTFPMDPAKYEADLRASTDGKPVRIVVNMPDGRVIVVLNHATESGGWVVTHEDITEHVRAERELEHTRQFLDTIIENVPSPIIVKDIPDLRYLLLNRAAENILGMSRDAILGKTARDVMPKQTAEKIEAEDRKLVESEKPLFLDDHIIVTPSNGTRIVTASRLPVMGEDGKPQYLISVITDVTDRKRSEQRIAHMAHHDPLTDLPNRAAFNECLRATIDLAAVAKDQFAVLCMDLDRFKNVNDVFGHAVGDALLREVGLRLQETCQGAFLARIGGDEFAAVTPTGPQPATAEALAERLTAALDSDIHVDGHALHTAVTVGVAIYPQDGADASTLVSNADAALFRAKSEARGSIRFFEVAMDKQLRDKRALQQDLRLAISRDELALHYQPQMQIGGKMIGFEALVRWHHPVHGVVPPGVFIPVAEESGSIVAIGEWILRTACREAASWPNPLQIAVNLSPVQFQHGDLVGMVHRVLLETGLPPARLELEITEGVLIGDFTRALALLRRLKNLGVGIAMDDFGTGYSSLSYLQSFPFDRIKIDRAFVANLLHSQQSATIIRAVIALGHGLDLPVIAEGVETEEQLHFLESVGCDGIQGYFVGRPKPIAEYANLVGRVDFTKKKKPTLSIAS